MSMKSKVVVVTGSSQGIGKAIAVRFLQDGYRVVINARKGVKLGKTAKELSRLGTVFAVQADISSFADCQRLVESSVARFGRLDVLVNNAGISMEGELHGMNPRVFQDVVAVNLLGSANMTNAALREIKRTQGQVLFVSSMAGLLGLPGYSAYSASKMALSALAQSLRGELHGEGVYVGLAMLGFTQNDVDKKIIKANGDKVRQPARNFIKPAPVDWVADRIFNVIQRRQAQAFIGPPGRIAAWANWMFPTICQWYSRRMYLRHVLSSSQRQTTTSLAENSKGIGSPSAAST